MGKNKVRRVVSMIMISVMLFGVCLTVNATEHVCAFSYMGVNWYSRTHIAYHTFWNEDSEEMKCEVVLDQYRDIYKCACGAFEYRNYRNLPLHLGNCGQ